MELLYWLAMPLAILVFELAYKIQLQLTISISFRRPFKVTLWRWNKTKLVLLAVETVVLFPVFEHQPRLNQWDVLIVAAVVSTFYLAYVTWLYGDEDLK